MLPHNIAANGYLTFKGAKISKTRGGAIWADEFLEKYPADRIRYYLTANAPEGRDTDYTDDDFLKRNNEELSDVLGNLCHRVFTFAERYFEGKVPEGVAGDQQAQALLGEIESTRDRWQQCLEACRFRDGLAAIIDLARSGNRAFDAAQPWKTRKDALERCGKDIGSFLEVVYAAGVLLQPYLPESAEKLLAAFGDRATQKEAIEELGSKPALEPGAALNAPVRNS